MAFSDFCLNCFSVKSGFEVCPYCGFVEGTPPEHIYHLYPGTVLGKRYVVGVVLGFGGFGVTYKAWDTKLNSVVAIKEFYPNGLVNRVPGQSDVVVFSGEKRDHFDKALERYLEEAKHMAKFSSEPNIVNVFDLFQENNTAYIVMELLEGASLKEFLESSGGRLDVDVALEIMRPIMDAVAQIHKKGIIHRDISPDNIYVTVDNRIKLIDFGAARFSTGDEEKTLSVVIKVGYAAPEQYRTKSKQNFYTDIYSLGATLYHMITGEKPLESVDRQVEDTLKRPSECGIQLTPNVERAIMKSMALKPEIRFAKVEDFEKAVYEDLIVDYPEIEIEKRRKQRLLITAIISVGFVACISYIVMLFTVWRPVERMAVEDMLPDTISISFPIDADETVAGEQTALYNSIAEEFTASYPDFTIEVRAIPSEQYMETLNAAIAANEQPTIFDTTNIDPPSDSAMSLEKLYNSLNYGDYLLLGDHEKLYPSYLKIPLAFRPTVAYINTLVARGLSMDLDKINGTTQDIVKYTPNANARYSFLMGERLFAVFNHHDSGFSEKVAGVYKEQQYDFADPLQEICNDSVLYLVEDVSTYRQIQTRLAGGYKVVPFTNNNKVAAYFTDEWSISNRTTENRQEIAMFFLTNLLSHSTQNRLFVQNNNSIPLNKNAFEDYIKTNTELKFVKDKINDIVLTGEKQPAVNVKNGDILREMTGATD